MPMAEVDRGGELLENAEVLKAMGHPVRLKIMLKLADKCCCVREIWDYLQMPQAVVSQHLKILKDRGVLESRREGVKVCYLITNSMIRYIVTALGRSVVVGKTVSV
jgi:ArsR family transcriptional regulator